MMWSSIKLSYCNIHSTLDISFINLVMSNNMQHSIPIGVSLPEHLVKRIDVVRGDIPRSKYIQRLLEWVLLEKNNSCDSLDSRLRDLQSSESGGR